MRQTRGFTLIELLVVIAIIAILAAILFPVFAKAREAAEKTQCLSNIKNLGTAVMQYVANYDNRLPDSDPMFWYPNPPGTPGVAPDNSYWGWARAIQPYMDNWDIMICPGRKEFQDGWTWMDSFGDTVPVDGAQFGYAYNGSFWLGCPGTGQPSDGMSGLDGYVPQNRLRVPAETIMFCDSGSRGSDELGDAQPGDEVPAAQDQAVVNWTTQTEPIGALYYPEGRHQEGFNVAWCDGHASWVRFDALYEKQPWTIEKD